MPEGMLNDADTRHLWRMNNDGTYPDQLTAVASVGAVNFDEGFSGIAAGPNDLKPYARLTSFAIKNNGLEGAFATAQGVDDALIDSYSSGGGMWISLGDVSLRTTVVIEYAQGGNIGIGIGILTTGAIRIFWDPGFAQSISAAGLITDGTWHHVAWRVFDAGGGQQTGEVYVDGVLAASLTAAYPTTPGQQQWVLGNAAHVGILNNVDAFDGRYCDLVIYASTPSVATIQTEATNPGGNYTQSDVGVLRHWLFQEEPALIDEADGLHMGPARPWITNQTTSILSAIRNAVPATRRCWDFNGSQDAKFRGFTYAQPTAEALRQLMIAGNYTIEVYIGALTYNPSGTEAVFSYVGDDTGDINSPPSNSVGRLAISNGRQLDNFWEYGTGNNSGAVTTTPSTSAGGDDRVPQYFACTVEATGATRTLRFYNSTGFVEEFTALTAADGGDAVEGGPSIGSSVPTDFAGDMFRGCIFEIRISDTVRSEAELDESRERIWGISGGGLGDVVRTNPLLIRSTP